MKFKEFIQIKQGKKIIIINIVFVFLVFLISHFFILAYYGHIKELGDKIVTQKMQLKNAVKEGRGVKELSKSMGETKEDAEIIESIFISENNGLELVENLERIAQVNNIDQKLDLMVSSKKEMITAGETYYVIPIKIVSKGQFSDQLKYLSEIESMEFYVNIKNIGMSSFSSNSESSERKLDGIEIALLADTYWLK